MAATHGVGTYGNAVGTVTPLDHKMAQLGLVVKTAANTIRAGLFWDGNATVVSGKANMSYDVRALTAVVSRGAIAGAVLLTNDAVYNVVTTAAPGSNSRYDVVYLWQREYSIDGTDSNPVIDVVQGTPAASPTVPSLAAFPGAISLAQILVPAGVTATNSGTTITQTAPFTSVVDGVVVARTTTERDAYTPPSTDLKARTFVIANGITYKWNGTVWKAWGSDWISYTPTLSGVAIGTGGAAANTASYRYIDGQVKVRGVITLGTTTSSVSGTMVVTLPVTALALRHPYQQYNGSATFYDTSAVQNYFAAPTANNASVTDINILSFYGANGLRAGTGASTPFVWAAGDSVSYDFTYDPA